MYCKEIVEEIQNIIDDLDLSCSVDEFSDKVDWSGISCYQNLTEDFIREFSDKVDWIGISRNQNLTEDFIREFSDKMDWSGISCNQNLTEDFIREFSDKVNWIWISRNQNLTEDFIREFSDKVDSDLYKECHLPSLSYDEKVKQVTQYAKEHDLTIEDGYLYAFRNHTNGKGMVKTTVYKKGTYYKDWHCDLNPEHENSYGFGIWPKGNTRVRVKIEDWGIAVNREDGKARVWGFEIVDSLDN